MELEASLMSPTGDRRDSDDSHERRSLRSRSRKGSSSSSSSSSSHHRHRSKGKRRSRSGSEDPAQANALVIASPVTFILEDEPPMLLASDKPLAPVVEDPTPPSPPRELATPTEPEARVQKGSLQHREDEEKGQGRRASALRKGARGRARSEVPAATDFKELVQQAPELTEVVGRLEAVMSFNMLLLKVIQLQRVSRGFVDRRRARRLRAERLVQRIMSGELEVDETSRKVREVDYFSEKLGYKTLRERFYRVMEKKVRKKVVKVKTVARLLISKARNEGEAHRAERDRQAAGLRIQTKIRQYLAIKKVAGMLLELEQNIAVTHIQASARMLLAVRRYRRLLAAHREALAHKQLQGRCASQIQRRYRGFRVRVRYWQQLQAIRRRLEERRLSRKDFAALRIQCAYRVYRACQARQNLAKEARAKWEREEEERIIRAEVERRHRGIDREAKAIIMQCAMRSFVARRKTARRRAERVRRAAMQKELQASDAVLRIQRVYRGHKARRWFGRNYQSLAFEREERSYCIECTGRQRNPATRLCRTCRDRYCDPCWKRFHARGNKRMHTYKVLEGDSVYDFSRFRQPTMGDWVEHWDSSVQATYYYNVRTGEASWVVPDDFEQASAFDSSPYIGYRTFM
jgi:hypothetical protein